MIVNGDMKVLPAHAFDMLLAIAVDAMTNTAEAAEFLDVEMKQIARSGMFVAKNRWGRFQIAQAIQSEAAQNAADGSRTERQAVSDACPGPTLATQPGNLLD